MVVGGIDLVASMLELGQESPALRVKMGYVYLAVPISGFFLTLYAVIGLVERLRPESRGLAGTAAASLRSDESGIVEGHRMNLPILVLVVSFLVLLLLNVPVAFCMGIAAVLAFLAMGGMPAFTAVAHNMATGIDSFSLLAIPFFVLSGLLMGHGGIARRLIDFANVLAGRYRGGLAYVNVADLHDVRRDLGLRHRGGLLHRRLHDPPDEQDGLPPRLQRRRDDHRRHDRPADPAEQHHDRLLARHRRVRLDCRHVHRGLPARHPRRPGTARRQRRRLRPEQLRQGRDDSPSARA